MQILSYEKLNLLTLRVGIMATNGGVHMTKAF